MPKVISQSNRIYYHEIPTQNASMIHHDLCLYNTMMHDAYHILYHKQVDDWHIENLHQYLKEKYSANDYFPLSAVSQAKGILKSNIEVHKQRIKDLDAGIKNINKKLKETEKKLSHYRAMKDSLIQISKAQKTGLSIPRFRNYSGSSIQWNKNDPTLIVYQGKAYTLYLFEVQIIDVESKQLKHRIKMLYVRKNNLIQKKQSLEKRMPSACFGSRKLMKAQYTKEAYIQNHEVWKEAFVSRRNHTMVITGRSQGVYCNNLFKYHVEEGLLYYYATSGDIIKLPIEFHLHHELLLEKLKLKHATPGKAVCYVLEDHGTYFIIKAIMELPVNIDEFCFFKGNGVFGLDINVYHLALSETDEHGNLIGTWTFPMKLKHKTTNQRKHIIRNVIKEVFELCEEKHKPLIIEKLDFSEKKQALKYGNKKYNHMISEFSYSQITECIYSRSYKTKIGIKEVNPAYTSRIGRLKYMAIKGISIHSSASYCIARRGQGYKEKMLRDYEDLLSEEQHKRHHWSKWSIIGKRFEKVDNQSMLYHPMMKLIELEGICA